RQEAPAMGKLRRQKRSGAASLRSSSWRTIMHSIWSARKPSSKRSWTSWMNPEPGEVWLADLGLAAKRRPVIIVSRSDSDPPRALAIYVPLTTQNRNSDYEIALPNCRSSRNFQSRMYRASLQFPKLVWSKSSVRYLDCTREIPTERGVAPPWLHQRF